MVEHWILIKTLEHYKLPPKLTQLIQLLYNNNSTEFFTPAGNFKTNITRGVKQGCGLSPLLFAIYINPILTKLRTSNKGYSFHNNPRLIIPNSTYADDTKILASNFNDFQDLLNIVQSH